MVRGALDVMVGGETRTLRPGEQAVAPANTLHNVHNPTGEPTTFLIEFRTGSAGFEKALKAGYGLAADGLTRADGTPKNLYYLAVLLEWSDMRLPGIVTVAEPLFRTLAKRSRRKGVDRELEARYCR